ncbi:MAG: glycosyltransferase, partial [Nitrospirae bacterium]|nr:glycosyltransferase [Nitrospirota bacterium]
VIPGVPTEFVPWSLKEESGLLCSFDIGIMPLADTPWARGKCGYKLLLYMSHGIPVVASPVGVNSDLILHGVNGYSARAEDDWYSSLRELVDHPERRMEMGGAGRISIEGRYDHAAGLHDLIRDIRDSFRPKGRREQRRVTMLLFYYPPLGGSGPLRHSILVRHVHDRGWNPAVVTVSRWPSYFRDHTLPHSQTTLRAAAPDPAAIGAPLLFLGFNRLARLIKRWVAFPDRSIFWAVAALPGALRLARDSAALFSTSPPESAHLLGWSLKKLTGRPWIADHSNEWADNPAREDPPFLISLHRRIERFVMASADRITTLSPHHTRLLKSVYPRPDRIDTLWTGWNPAEARPPEMRHPGGKAVVLFTGMFYGIQRPDPFLDAAERAGLRDIEFHVLGDAWDSSGRLSRSTIPVRLLGRIPRAQALERMREADFLLITLTERAAGVVPGKMCEYSAAGRPILAVVPPDGEVARWIRETRTGFVIPCAPIDEAALELRSVLEQWRLGSLRFAPVPEALERYSQPTQARIVDQLLHVVVNSRRVGK